MKVGIEFECIDSSWYSDDEERCSQGIEIFNEQQNEMFSFECIRDGSVGGDSIEYVSKPISARSLKSAYDKLCYIYRKLYENTTIDRTCGSHIHLSFGSVSFMREIARDLWKVGIGCEQNIFEMLPPSRRSNSYCKKLPSYRNDFPSFEGDFWGRPCSNNKYDNGRYHWLNFEPLFRRGLCASKRTIEIRCIGNASPERFNLVLAYIFGMISYVIKLKNGNVGLSTINSEGKALGFEPLYLENCKLKNQMRTIKREVGESAINQIRTIREEYQTSLSRLDRLSRTACEQLQFSVPSDREEQ